MNACLKDANIVEKYLDSEYIINLGSCFYRDNPKCTVKPITEYNIASSEVFVKEINEISSDKLKVM